MKYITLYDYTEVESQGDLKKEDIIRYLEEIENRFSSKQREIIQIYAECSSIEPDSIKIVKNGCVQQYVGVIQYQPIGREPVQIKILPRLFKNKKVKESYFLNYLLEKTKHSKFYLMKNFWVSDLQEFNYRDLLTLTFDYYVQRSMSKGYFSEYRNFQQNDMKLAGKLEVSRHIKDNLSQGTSTRMAYSQRRQTVDNYFSYLILKVFNEEINTDFLSNETYIYLKTLQSQLEFSYRDRTLKEILIANDRPIHHPYYQSFEELRRISIYILQNKRIGIGGKDGKEDKKSFSFLTNMNQLWEVFLDQTLMKELRKTGWHDFRDKKKVYHEVETGDHLLKMEPDFVLGKNDEACIVFDAKNKPRLSESMDRNDLYQLFTYTYGYGVRHSGIVYPKVSRETILPNKEWRMIPHDDKVFKKIPYTILELGNSLSKEKTFKFYDEQNQRLSSHLIDWINNHG